MTGEIIFKAEVRLDPVAATILNVYFETSLFQGGILGRMTSYINFPPGYPRPKSATPIDVSLVPAYVPCEFPLSPNRAHAPPMSHGSCAPPITQSGFLTVGTFDSNGQASQSVGHVKSADRR